jgi:hypothetical protein
VSSIFFVLFAYSYLRYRKSDIRDDLNAAVSMAIIAILILAVNMITIHPLASYDSVAYYAEFRTNASSTVVLPWPDERILIREIQVVHGDCEYKVVDTEKGKGLEVDFSSFFYLEGNFSTSIRKVNYKPDLMEEGNFYIHFQSEDMNASCRLGELRIVHQSPTDFHSRQIVSSRYSIEHGWNSIEYERYPD